MWAENTNFPCNNHTWPEKGKFRICAHWEHWLVVVVSWLWLHTADDVSKPLYPVDSVQEKNDWAWCTHWKQCQVYCRWFHYTLITLLYTAIKSPRTFASKRRRWFRGSFSLGMVTSIGWRRLFAARFRNLKTKSCNKKKICLIFNDFDVTNQLCLSNY